MASGDSSDALRSFEEICEENGFAHERHEVVTEDGYILSLWRVPGKLEEGVPTGQKPPIIFQHGLFGSSIDWIVNKADIAPAFVAANAGYDVWLGNNRGNTYSRAHKTLSPETDGKEFFDFSWYEMGTMDQPANFDYIRGQTNE
jgi:pimeloyl-ACP methyl ester carboxylesterase